MAMELCDGAVDWPRGNLSLAAIEASLALANDHEPVMVSPSLSEEPFTCLAAELEQQAAELELEAAWFNPSQQAAARSAPAPAASDDLLALLQCHMEAAAAQQQAEQETAEEQAVGTPQQQAASAEEQQPQPPQQIKQQPVAAGAAMRAAALDSPVPAGSGRGTCRPCAEPCTPQRRSAGDNSSSWNESPLPGSGLECGEVQSPAPATLLGLPSAPPPPCPAAARSVPLQLAILNARRVRLGQEPLLGAWRGCSASAWCAAQPGHSGACTAAALVPGLRAYPSQELFESGVNVEELCRAPAGPAPDCESGEGEGALAPHTWPGAATADDCLSSGKRRACEAGDDGASQSGVGGCGGAASTGSAHGGSAEGSAGCSHAAKRLRADASSSAITCDLLGPAAAAELVGSSHGPGAPGDSTPLCGRMVPVALPLQALTPAPLAPPVPLLGGSAAARNRGRPAGAPRLRPLPPPPPPAPVPPPQPVAHQPSKPVTRQKNHSGWHHHAAAAAPGERRSAPRATGRRAILQWHTDSVVDPRTGAVVTQVAPATFCTQCCALSTPVWRAGPFGTKTLCNACGVRWMKHSKGSKK